MRARHILHLLVMAFITAWPLASRAADASAGPSSGTAAPSSGSAGTPSAGPPPPVASSAGTPLASPSPSLAPAAEEWPSDAIYEMKASLGLGLEYNDNINERANNKTTDFITHIRPAFSFKRLGGRIQADINYRGDYLYYLKDKDTEEYRHYIDALVTGELVANFFFLSVKEEMQQVYRDVLRGEADDDETLNDLINRNRFTIAPFFKLRPDERTNAVFGYTFTDIRYSKGLDDQSPDPISFNSDQYDFNYKKSRNHKLYWDIDHELNERAVLYAGANIVRWMDDNRENVRDQSFYRYTVYVGGAYEFSENLAGSVKLGPSYSDPDEQAAKLRPFLEADLIYTIGRSKFTLYYLTDYEDNATTGGSTRRDAIGIRWDKDFTRSRLAASFSYNKYENEVDDVEGYNKGNTYRPELRYTYDLTARLSCFIAYHALIYEDRSIGDHRHYASYGLKYALSENGSVGISHQVRYKDAYEDDSYFANRVMLDFTYTF